MALLAAQGYVQRASGTDEWMTTPAGESVSGAKPPRFTRESVEQAVESLKYGTHANRAKVERGGFGSGEGRG
jgi:hypothetical protein